MQLWLPSASHSVIIPVQDYDRIDRLQAAAKEQAQQKLDRRGISRYQSVEIEEVSEEAPTQGGFLCPAFACPDTVASEWPKPRKGLYIFPPCAIP